ncbi:MFS transporter [Paenibacillus rhizophilus]|uniref:MFS transporter n=1 Tax=Paenibacillus rhizophilus TaxID=1850366 RepID=A0A3N9P0G3_9BACL|nr:MFS transporter [Paenibacillus rhizophilus]RQW09678.1 MFS transporter [Paenibacillus rhizophilus]
MNYKLFNIRSFSLYIFGGLITLMGDELLTIALALYVLKLSGSASQYAGVLTLSALPSILLAPFAGAIVDRVNKNRLIVLLDFLRGIALIPLYLYSLHHVISLWDIYALALFFGICDSFYQPAAMTLLPAIVDKEQIVSGNLINKLFWQVGKIIAPAFAVLLYGWKGLSLVLLLDAVTFFVTGVMNLFIKLRKIQTETADNRIMSFVKDGFRLYRDKEILSISINGMLTHMLILPLFLIGLPFLVKSVFAGSDPQYGTVQSFYSAATLFAFVTVPLVNKSFKDLKALNVGMYGMLGAILLLFLIPIPGINHSMHHHSVVMITLLSLISFLFSLCFSTYGVFFTSFNQKKVGNAYLGRFYAVLFMLFAIGRVIGNSIYGALFDTRILVLPIALACVGMILKLLLNYAVTSVTPVEPVQGKLNS